MATLTSTKIKNTYDALLKATDNDAIGSSAKQITDGLGNGTPLYISTTQIGIGVTPEATYDLHVYSNAKVGGNLTVTGDLTVEGTTTTIDTQTLTVEDPLIEVASNNTSTDAVDIGWYGKYAPSGTTLYAGLFRDTGDSKFKLFRNLEEQPTTTVNTSGTGYTVATLVADVEGTLTGTIASSTIATTQSAGDNSTKVATTAYVDTSIGNSTLAEILVNGNTTSGTDIAISSGDDITFVDDSKAIFGTDGDLEIYHYSITDKATISINGELDMRANTLELRNYAGETYFRASSNGAVRLYYDAAEKFITTSTGISVTDTVSATTFSGQLDGTISSTTTATTQTQGDNSTKVATTAYVDSAIGGQDTLAEILANGNTTGGTDIAVSSGDSITFAGSGSTSTVINHSTYDTRIINDNSLGSIILRSADTVMQNAAGTETIAHFYENGAVELYYDNSKKFETTSTGVSVSGTVSLDNQLHIEQAKSGSSAENYDLIRLNLTGTGAIGDSSSIVWYSTSGTKTAGIEGVSGQDNILYGEIVFNVRKYTTDSFDEALRINNRGNTIHSGNVEVNGTLIDLDSSASATIAIDRGATSNDAIVSFRNAGAEYFKAGLQDTDSNLWSLLHTCGSGLYFEGNSMSFGFNTEPSYDIDLLKTNAVSMIRTPDTTSPTLGLFVNSGSNGVGTISVDNGGHMTFDTGSTGAGQAERMRIDSSGNVGIGETNPSSYGKLVIKNDTSSGAGSSNASSIWLLNSNTTANNASSIFFGDNGTTAAGAINFINTDHTNEYGEISFDTRGSGGYGERMRIDSNGNTTFTGTLDVASTIYTGESLRFNGTGLNATDKKLYSPSDGCLEWFTHQFAGTPAFAVSHQGTKKVLLNVSGNSYFNGGNVGIGTTSPTSKLDIAWGGYQTSGYALTFGADIGNLSTRTNNTTKYGIITGVPYTNTNPNIELFTYYSNNTSNSLGIGGQGNTDLDGLNSISFLTAPNQTSPGQIRMTVDSSGDVGIGVTSPDCKLDVNGIISPKGNQIRLAGGTDANHFLQKVTTGYSGGTIDGPMLQGHQGGELTTNYGGNNWALRWATGGEVYMNGDVGIGTTSIGARIDIKGTAGSPATSGTTQNGILRIQNATNNNTLDIGQVAGTPYGTWLQAADKSNLNPIYTYPLILNPNGGNVGIGLTSPSQSIDTSGKIRVRDGGNTTIPSIQMGASGVDGLSLPTTNNIAFITNSTERMRINSLGRVDIGTRSYVGSATSTTRLYLEGNTNGHNLGQFQMADLSGGFMFYLSSSSPTSRQSHQFYNNRIDSSPTLVGSIQINSSSTAFNTSSDYRLKENVVEMTGALDRVEQLKPSRFNFIGHEEIVDGFLAHEVSDIVPEAITGEKDEVDAEGNPVYQGIDQSKLVPLLVGAIQELKAEIETLKAQINN